jgi:putative sugar O-methyltransferase
MDRDPVLEACRDNYRRSKDYGADLPDFGNRWGMFKQQMSTRIMNFASTAEAIEFGQLRCNFDHRGMLSDTDMPEIQMARRMLAYEYPRYAHLIDSFSDTDVSTPGSYLPLQTSSGASVRASKILYFHALYVLTVITQVDDVRSICEIGGGYGNPAWLWMNCPAGPISTYCIVDLPESLFFAEAFLRSALPEVEIIYVHGEDVVEKSRSSRRIYLVPIQHYTKTSQIRFDVAVNTGSLAEMTDEWVAFWSEWLDKQTATHFYSFNFFGNPVDKLFEGRATFAPRVSGAWQVKYVRAMHPLMLLQSEERRAAEILFSRAASTAFSSDELGICLRGMQTLKLSLDNYIALAYKAQNNKRRTIEDAIDFIKKVLHDFGYPPVELLSLITNITNDENFENFDGAGRDYIMNLQADLRRKFQLGYPKGTHSL